MKDATKKKSNIFLTVPILLVEVIIGVLLIVSPTGLVKGIVVTFGLMLIIFGVLCAVDYIRRRTETPVAKLVFGIIIAAGGLVLALCCNLIVTLFPTIAVLYGIGLFISAGVKIPQLIGEFKNSRAWITELCGVIVLIISGLIALLNPFEAVSALFIAIAVGLFIDAALSLVSLIISVRSRKKPLKIEIIE